ncbi:glycosyltransferase [Acetobacter oeni]|uniref:Glycosyl transferase family 2 n=1 Tax=Acetobacter oeni TaxID=304077 RepID=A0A511XI75_9PROT|nr:glycosyltransferase [Acetobacter oeni]MBB3883060.1 hopene-associated glycosyltransferase HpnB [Acetobacter oeni]NHO19136.1 glycosyltransferase [Acetobacter oeni]GBR11520.1 glycosyltransferase [Acetobacter oeni LMG 21952]GEN62646.1 glycosyl transferase family 2 [Acetobacter oeni]
MMAFFAAVSAVIWVLLIFFHGKFWQAGPVLRRDDSSRALPPVSVVVPARDEAESIGGCLESLLAQDYAGPFGVVLTDDGSVDGTGGLARKLPDPAGKLTVIDGLSRPPGWSGKLWAVQQGVMQVRRDNPEDDGYILLTDADIEHDPVHVSTLVEKAEREQLDLVSEMVELNCASVSEKALVPAFVFFFALLYPFARVNEPANRTAAAAGGTILIRRSALTRIGGIEALKGALIDDCTLAAHVKGSGGKIYLGHSCLARSVRPYPHPGDIWKMIARTAYVQLRYSPLLLLGTVIGMVLVWIAPVFFVIFGRGLSRKLGFVAWSMAMASYTPTLRRFRLSPLWALLLPAVAVFYTAATIGSAFDHHRGRGVQWKNRAYTDASHDR